MKTLTAKVVAAYLGNNAMAVNDVSDLIQSVYSTLIGIGLPIAELELAAPQQPAIPIKNSVTLDAIICLECGRPQKMIKRHLNAAHGLSAPDYRSKSARKLPAGCQ